MIIDEILFFQDPLDHSQCKAREGHPSLLFAHKSDVRKIDLFLVRKMRQPTYFQ